MQGDTNRTQIVGPIQQHTSIMIHTNEFTKHL